MLIGEWCYRLTGREPTFCRTQKGKHSHKTHNQRNRKKNKYLCWIGSALKTYFNYLKFDQYETMNLAIYNGTQFFLLIVRFLNLFLNQHWCHKLQARNKFHLCCTHSYSFKASFLSWGSFISADRNYIMSLQEINCILQVIKNLNNINQLQIN